MRKQDEISADKCLRIIIAHPAQQHSYMLASALKKKGMLLNYVTTVYYKRHSLTFHLTKLLKGSFREKAKQRHCDSINDCEVIQFCEIEGLFKLLCIYIKPLKRFYKHIKYHVADRFAKKVAKYAIRHNADIVITYDDCSPILFEILKKKAPQIRRVLDVSAANRLFMKEIYDTDMLIASSFSNRLKRECSIIWDKSKMNRIERELSASEFFLVPSEFVKKSLYYSGIKSSQIKLCPYGVDIISFKQKTNYSYKNDTPLRFIFVGGVKELKGISYLLEAFMQISTSDAQLIIVGNTDNGEDIEPYKKRVVFTGRVLHSQIPQMLHKSDVFIFPSLGDSFSLSAMEAASCGLPLIVSQNTGMCDLMTDGKEGFIINIQSVEEIVDRVKWFICNKAQIYKMGCAAREMAEKCTWSRYDERIYEIFNNEIE